MCTSILARTLGECYIIMSCIGDSCDDSSKRGRICLVMGRLGRVFFDDAGPLSVWGWGLNSLHYCQGDRCDSALPQPT